MNIEIYGRHALLFDDDASAAFVNSDDALVEWNSLLIDRYDVRHLLSNPPPSRRRRNPQTSHSSSADADLDYERYLDLPPPAEEEEEDAKPEPIGGFNAVPFSYGNGEESNDQKTVETEQEVPKFHPPFPVPDSLFQNLPPTEKVHQIIARTALFVSKNGGQSEIILRVKQGDNPTFGFLMPDHHMHPYFRFLVDNQDLLHSKDKGQPENEETLSNTGALSLLGSVYGTGEDDDVTEHPSSSKDCVSGNTMNVDDTDSLAAGKTMLQSDKDDPILKRNSLSNALKAGRSSSIKKGEFSGSVSSAPDKARASSLPPIPKAELMLVDPPSDMKRLVEKIVEFIIKNGRQFEAVLMEQDRGHGRFPFLIPANIFHPYYLKVLQKAQEPKLTSKSIYNEKEDLKGHISNKKKATLRENENNVMESDDIPLDSERKEKFKMVINKSKKEGSDLPAKSTQSPPRIQVDADQAAAILQAATRGIKPSNLGILYGQPSNEVGSSESNLTHEQKLKAERLKRAKMFVAQLKSGAAPSKAEPSRGLSAEPQDDNRLAAKETEKSTSPSNLDTSDNKLKTENEHLNEEKRATRKYRTRSLRDKKDDDDDDDDDERERKRPRRHKEDDDDGVDDDDDERERKRSHRHYSKRHRSHDHLVEDKREDKYNEERDYKHAKRRHRSHRSSHKHDDNKIAGGKDQKYSKKKHQSSSSYEDDDQESEHEYSRKKHRSHHSSHDEVDSDDKDSRKKRKHRSSHRHKHRKSHSSRHKEKLDVSSEEESRDRSKADKNIKGPNSEREELEDGEVSGPSKGGPLVDRVASREPSVDVSSSFQDPRPLTQPSGTTEVSDDLRAKIRAMLMSTM